MYRAKKEQGNLRGYVRDWMSTPAVVVQKRALIGQAAGIMLARKFLRLPVVDADGKLEGVISRSDVFKKHLDQKADLYKWMEIDPMVWSPAFRASISWTTGGIRRPALCLNLVCFSTAQTYRPYEQSLEEIDQSVAEETWSIKYLYVRGLQSGSCMSFLLQSWFAITTCHFLSVGADPHICACIFQQDSALFKPQLIRLFIVFQDGDCEMCRSLVRMLQRHDNKNSILYVNIASS
jgi:CBS domain